MEARCSHLFVRMAQNYMLIPATSFHNTPAHNNFVYSQKTLTVTYIEPYVLTKHYVL